MVERIEGGSVIIVEGRIYALFHEIQPTTNWVCERCELRETCGSDEGFYKLSGLCQANDVPWDGFFLECSPISSKRVQDIAFQQNPLEADLSLDEATADL